MGKFALTAIQNPFLRNDLAKNFTDSVTVIFFVFLS